VQTVWKPPLGFQVQASNLNNLAAELPIGAGGRCRYLTSPASISQWECLFCLTSWTEREGTHQTSTLMFLSRIDSSHVLFVSLVSQLAAAKHSLYSYYYVLWSCWGVRPCLSRQTRYPCISCQVLRICASLESSCISTALSLTQRRVLRTRSALFESSLVLHLSLSLSLDFLNYYSSWVEHLRTSGLLLFRRVWATQLPPWVIRITFPVTCNLLQGLIGGTGYFSLLSEGLDKTPKNFRRGCLP